MTVKRVLTRGGKGSWKKTLEQAKAMLLMAKVRVRKLELAVQTCEEKVKNKDPWPC
jgi:hypothetical protein